MCVYVYLWRMAIFSKFSLVYVYPGGGVFQCMFMGGQHVLLEDTLQLLYSKDTNDNQLVHNMTQSLVSHLHCCMYVCYQCQNSNAYYEGINLCDEGVNLS